MNPGKLIFTKGNAKLDKKILIFNLPAGHSCPQASKCLSKVDPVTGTLKDGKNTIFRCFAASQEVLFPNVRVSRNNNFESLRKCKSAKQMEDLIVGSLPDTASLVRVHASGDFFNKTYFQAWINVAKAKPNVIFYAYTKSLNFWIEFMGQIPANLKLTASRGGRLDHLIEEHNLKYAQVVFSEKEAEILGLEIDHDDSHAFTDNKPFALLLHGVQPAGSNASKALWELKRQGIKGYSKTRKRKELQQAA